MGNIILYWMRWSGKSSLWKLLSNKLNKDFIDLDSFIEEKIWEKINTFVEKNDWEIFRNKEYEYLKEVLENQKDIVLSLWWWTIIFERNQKLILKNNYKLIYIYSSLEEVSKRISKDEKNWNKRNPLNWKSVLEELEEVYEKRKEIYESFYDLKINNNWDFGDSLDQIISKINYWNICVPIVDFSSKLEENISIINTNHKIKYVELRIDFLENLEELEMIIPKINKQIILTNRSQKEWWNFIWNSLESYKILSKYSSLWVNYTDFELLNWDEIFKLKKDLNKNTKIILSYHNFEKTPRIKELKEILIQMSKYSPDVYKIALMPKTQDDIKIIYELKDYFKANFIWDFIFISMWELWMQTRINIPQSWWLLSFWSLSHISAPWQIGFKQLHKKIWL